MTDDLTIRAGDLIPPYCAWGLRAFWRLHGLDFADFLRNGITASALLATDDELARKAVAHVELTRGANR